MNDFFLTFSEIILRLEINSKVIYSLSVERKKFLFVFLFEMIKCPRKGLKCKIKEPLKNEWSGE